jgi:hypothetical protein
MLMDNLKYLMTILQSVADDLRRGADKYGLTAQGVDDIATRCEKAIQTLNESEKDN